MSSAPAAPPRPPLLRRHRQLAPRANIKVSPLCLGAMSFGAAGIKWQGETTKADAFAIMDAFYRQGGNFVDTASGYQAGQSEEWVGEWMEARGVRDEMVLSTKFGLPLDGGDGPGIRSNQQGIGSKSLRLSLAASLRRLRTDYVDILYVHYWDFATTIPELMNALHHLVVAGKALHLGISDSPAWVVSKANQYARDHALTPFAAYQGKYNAACRDLERDILPMCRDEGMAVVPWGTLNQDRFQTAAAFAERARTGEGRAPASAHDRHVSAVLEAVAARKGCTLHQLALAYVRQKAPYVVPVVGSCTVAHLQGSIDGLAVELTGDEAAEVEGAYPFDHGFPHSWLSGSCYEPEGRQRGAGGPEEVWLNGMGGVALDWVGRPRAVRPHRDS